MIIIIYRVQSDWLDSHDKLTILLCGLYIQKLIIVRPIFEILESFIFTMATIVHLFPKSNYAVTLPYPQRITMCDFVKIGKEMVEEFPDKDTNLSIFMMT